MFVTEFGPYCFLGLLTGVLMSAPVGPVNLMCLTTAVRAGFWPGFYTGSGAVFADIISASVAIAGLSWVIGFVETYQQTLALVGGCVVAFFALRLFLDRQNDRIFSSVRLAEAAGRVKIVQNFLAAFIATLTNPGAILGFSLVFASLNSLAPEAGDLRGWGFVIAGQIVGCCLWWAMISYVATRLKSSLSIHTLHRLQLGAGVLLVALSAVMIAIGLGVIKADILMFHHA